MHEPGSRVKKRLDAAIKRAALSKEFTDLLAKMYESYLDSGKKAADALVEACGAVDRHAFAKIKACPQEKSMVMDIMLEIRKNLRERLEERATRRIDLVEEIKTSFQVQT